ncbi:uncharacterized protein LAESUDRAFT_698797 [Laetiporus sulphureus 93-53]|uniref:Small ribosomal subunit protein mS29 n=1 Tax=Laetiporus sulphureus 93-53 TaxID=1314785 RepID=A0A165EPF6_9APHY|nr:uncharacterized protein LAESUDRAFT_698797 [Laetiporus sulphureus 93-53]KZT07490.1 hypothetical protein LAESUDRAFT_698797 [Laetiporus sulphureus 93-53]
MSALATLRSSRILVETLAGASRTNSALTCVSQKRWASQDKQPQLKTQSAQGFKGKGKDQKKKKSRSNDIGTYLPLPVNQLSSPLFRTNYRSELKLPLYSPEALTDAAVGTAMQFPKSENEAMRAYGLPRQLLLEFRILSKPCSVVRDVTLKAVNSLDAASRKPSRDTRLVMTGPSGCGKSFTLLQAVEYAAHSNWIVLYIPRAIKLVNSSTTYSYDARTRSYVQPDASYELLRRFLSVNGEALQSLKTQEEFVYGNQHVPSGSPLPNLIAVGTANTEFAPAVLSSLMVELSRQSKYPVLLAVDDIQGFYRYSTYRDQHYHCIMAHHLAIPRMVLEYAGGKKSFPRGAIFGAESTGNTTFLMPLELREALGLPSFRPAGPYVARVPEFVEYAQGLQNFPVPPQLTVNEAASIFEVWMEDQALHSGEVKGEKGDLHSVPNDDVFMTKYCEASGNARAFVWKALLGTISTL